MLENYFQGTKEHPYHLSVGAIVKNDKDEICCHYFDKPAGPGFKYGTFGNFYLLMGETLEQNESIEQCLEGGLMEEFGMKAVLKSYIGSLDSHWIASTGNIKTEKTTLYFLCDLIPFDISKRKENDPEKSSIIKWVPINELIEKMKEQGKRLENTTLDESAVLERIVQL